MFHVMRNKFFLIILLSLLIAGCANEGVKVEEPQVNYQPYYDLVDKVASGLKDGFSEEEMLLKEYGGLGLSTCIYRTNYRDYEVIGYMYKDLDGDGIDELLLGENSRDGTPGWDSIIYNIFTLKDGELFPVAYGEERHRLYLCEDGTIAVEGSSGAAYTSLEYFRYSDGELSIIESCFSTEAAGSQIAWHHSFDEAYMGEATDISKEEAWELIDSHVYQKLDFTWFEYELNKGY